MNWSPPRVSIGMPVYNGEPFLQTTLDAVLSQTFEDFELVISDNASTDRTEQICRRYVARDSRIRYVRNHSNIGAVKNAARVLQLSSGMYFRWAAHDDLIASTFLERCVEVLDRRPDVVLCFPEIGYIDVNGELIRRSQEDLSIGHTDLPDRLRDFVRLQVNSTDIFWSIFGLIRKRALQITGPFDTCIAADRILLMKLLLLGQFHQIPELLYFRREHPEASTVRLSKLSNSRKYHEAAKWYDSSSDVRVALPNWRLSREYFTALKGHRIDLHTRARCYYYLAKLFALRWRHLGLELFTIPAQILGRRRPEVSKTRTIES